MKRHLTAFLQWLSLGALVGVACGLACGLASAAFLFLLDKATHFRDGHELLVYALPLCGALMGAVYETRWGRPVRGGNNLVLDTLHDDAPQLPVQIAPLVLLGTVATHLFGGSAGREGTAVQMGASLSDFLAHRLKLSSELRRQVLAAGIAGGFGSVFGTPIAGTVFGLEVIVVGRLEYQALIPALVASVVGDLVTRGVGIVHTAYPQPAALPLTPLLFGKWVVFSVAVALAAVAFIELVHGLKRVAEAKVPFSPLRLALGGLAVVFLWKLSGTSRYLGLGVPTIVASFTDPSLPPWAFAAKLLFTAVTLGFGFLGGEVTPLFFVGATLGAVVGPALGIPQELAAGVGLAALFGAAANTPLALSVMAVELLGGNLLPHVFIVAVVAFLLTGHRGIYPSQRLSRLKHGAALEKPTALRHLE